MRRDTWCNPDPKTYMCWSTTGFHSRSSTLLVYITDIHVVKEIQSNINSFADDICLSMVVGNPNAAGIILQNDINRIILWADKWLVRFNPSKSESLIISRKRNKPTRPDLLMNDTVIPQVNIYRHLRVFISSDGSWDNHLEYIIDKSRKKINIMRHPKSVLDRLPL